MVSCGIFIDNRGIKIIAGISVAIIVIVSLRGEDALLYLCHGSQI